MEKVNVMCQLKSGIILKDKIFIPDYDSHTDMLAELGIKDTKKNAETLFVRAELSPTSGIFSDISEWKFRVDQNIVPEWFVRDYEETRMREAVAEWLKVHVHIGKSDFSIKDGLHYLKDCKNVTVYNSSTVTAYDSSTVTVYNSSTIVLPSWSSNKRENIALSDNATLKDCRTKTIYQSGDWKLERV